jgi:hypothetical protein
MAQVSFTHDGVKIMIENWKELFSPFREVLTGLPIVGNLGPYAALTLVVWVCIWAVRRYRPAWWAWMLRLGPDPEGALLHFYQSVPGALLGAVLAGGTTLELEQAAWGLLCGPAAALWHHVVKVAPVPYQGALRAIKSRASDTAKKSLLLLVLLLTQSCTVSLEKARTTGISQKQAGSSEYSSDALTKRCQKLDNARMTWGAVAVGAGVISGTSGISTIPFEDSQEEIAASAALGAAVVGGVAYYVKNAKDEAWARDCSER